MPFANDGEPRSGYREEWAWTLLVAAAAAALASVPEALRPGFYFHDDMQSQYVPIFRELAAGWARGELPLVTDKTWFGGAIAGEYQHGCFSVVHALLGIAIAKARLGPPATALALTLSYVTITSAGAFRLARHYGVGRWLAASVAWSAALNGFAIYWCSWLPSLTGFAWLPWLWWAAVRRLDSEPRHGHAALAFTTYCLLCAGWHFALLMAALVLAMVALLEPRPRTRFGNLLALAPGLTTGALLAMPALLCFAEYVHASTRTGLGEISWTWTTPLGALQGLLVPRSASLWHGFGTPKLTPNVALSGGTLALVILPAAVLRLSAERRRQLAPLLGLSGLALLLAVTPNLGSARWPFRWLPLAHLGLALAAARAVQQWSEAPAVHPRRWLASPLVLVVPLLAIIAARQPSGLGLLNNVALVTLCAAALTWRETRPGQLPAVFTFGVAANLLLTPLAGPPRELTPRWEAETCFRGLEGLGRRHLGLYLLRHVLRVGSEREPTPGSCFFPGNLGLLYDRPTVSGYSLLFPPGIGQVLELHVHGDFGERQIVRALTTWSAPGSLLDRWGVEALTVPSGLVAGSQLLTNGWRVVGASGDAQLLTRPPELLTPQPLVSVLEPSSVARSIVEAREWLLANDGRGAIYVPNTPPAGAPLPANAHAVAARITLLSSTQTHVSAHIAVARGAGTALIRILRPYLPGYRATFAGQPVAMGRADGAFLVAEVPAGMSGVLNVDYCPLGVRWPGVLAFALGSASLLWLALGDRSRLQRLQKPS